MDCAKAVGARVVYPQKSVGQMKGLLRVLRKLPPLIAIRELNRRMNIPSTPDGIVEADIPKMAKHAAKEANPLYPVPRLMSARELRQFYYKVAGANLQ